MDDLLEEVERLRDKARTYRDAGQYLDALSLLEQALLLTPDTAAAWIVWFEYGVILRQLGRYDDAIGAYLHSLKLCDPRGDTLNNVGHALIQLKRFKEAVRVLNQAISLDPDFARTWSNLADALNLSGRRQESLAAYDRALSLDLPPEMLGRTLCGKAVALRELRRYKEALKTFDAALTVKPDDPIILTEKAQALVWIRRYRDALPLIERAVQLSDDVDRAGMWANFGIVLYKVKRYNEAMDAATESIRLDPSNWRPWMTRLRILVKRRRWREARQTLRQVVRLQLAEQDRTKEAAMGDN